MDKVETYYEICTDDGSCITSIDHAWSIEEATQSANAKAEYYKGKGTNCKIVVIAYECVGEVYSVETQQENLLIGKYIDEQ